MRRPRGFLLITSLLVCVVLLLIGMGLLGSQVSRMEAAKQSGYTAQARQLALAGLEDARLKMELDIEFPPPPGPGQHVFSYSENLAIPTAPGNDPVAASYLVTVDMTHATTDPERYITVTAVGTVGPSIKPIAQYRLRGELDNHDPDLLGPRPTTGSPAGLEPNRRFFRYTYIHDEEVP